MQSTIVLTMRRNIATRQMLPRVIASLMKLTLSFLRSSQRKARSGELRAYITLIRMNIIVTISGSRIRPRRVIGNTMVQRQVIGEVYMTLIKLRRMDLIQSLVYG